MQRVIYLEPAAPPKPPEGAPCNGCGTCCMEEPCPVGALFSRRLRGACQVLAWDARQSRYRCGLLSSPRRHLPAALRPIAPLLVRLARRWIAAGQGCDSTAEAMPAAPPPLTGPPPEAQAARRTPVGD